MRPSRGKPPSRQRVVIVGVSSRAVPRSASEEHLDELERLVESAGGEVVGRVVKDRPAPDPATYVGRGAAEEIGEKARERDAGLVVFDDELTPAQVRNLEERWGEEVTALDRPGLILDVFASHARTREARTQVNLAQLQYLLPRLAGRYGHLSRLAGGIGGRGAGEQKLELDRRKIRDRIARLRRDLEKIETSRQVRRRSRAGRFQVAISGYTNAGKTTLFNRLTRESAYAADRLFATLDSKSAHGASPKLSGVIFVDTVGFVRKLPPSLVASFRSTLSEIRDADLVLHVLDASSPRVDEERRIANEVLGELGVGPGRILPVWNKTDRPGAAVPRGEIGVSAATGAGLPALERAILLSARPEPERFTLRIPYTSGRSIAAARGAFRVVEEQDLGDSLWLVVAGERKNVGSLARYLEEPLEERVSLTRRAR
ncbi:MAG TPA: GTPase HflX [Thermoanaerobaculia bacterium]|nr:GTPase HflX [Thermoanaerobaculia bacterium]